MRALVIGASGGIGSAVVGHLSARGDDVTALSRSADGLDVTDEAQVARVIGRLSGPFDLVMCATGALELHGAAPEKTLRNLDVATMAAQFTLNAVGPAILLKHVLPLMPKGSAARFAALSARVGSIGDNGLGGWYSYRAAKAALNQLIHTAAIEIARTHPMAVVACLHPGTVATPLTARYAGNHATVSPSVAAGNLIRVIETLTPSQSGGFYDWQGKEIPW